MSEKDSNENNKVVFIKKSKKSIRHTRTPIEDEGDKTFLPHLENIREKQKLRQRAKGMSIVGLALGKKLAPEEELVLKDPFNLKAGGLVNMKSLRSGKMDAGEDEYDVDIGTQFSAETNKRDEDEEMMKYIERELEKRKGLDADNKQEGSKWMSPEDAALFALPEHLRKSNSHRSEEMLSYQMLNGIPEVDLGITIKIKNIEATEEAKQKLIQARLNKKDLPSHFVPTNMAVNFMQHIRFDIEENPNDRRKRRNDSKLQNQQEKQKKNAEEESVVNEVSDGNNKSTKDANIEKQNQHRNQTQFKHPNNRNQHNNNSHSQYGPNGVKRATDDYHYDKFKKQFRRY